MNRQRLTLSTSCLVALLAACSAGTGSGGLNDSEGTGATGQGGETLGTGGSPSSDGGNGGESSGQFMGVGGSVQGIDCDPQGPDFDQDGFTIEQGDCNDCDENVNPGAIEVIGAAPDGEGGGGGGGGEYVPADEDCDGTADNVAQPCDDGLAVNASSPLDGARAIELCKQAASDTDWGIVTANWVRGNGTVLDPTAAQANAQVGILANFGTNVPPRTGASLLALSSGKARLPGQPGACTLQTCTTTGYNPGFAPTGFPQDVPDCSGAANVNDDVGLDITLRAPTNATGFKFNFRFNSFEYPEWVCSSFNDQFIALVSPPPAGSVNGNICFDSQTNPVSVNIAFFEVCAGCSLGTTDLIGSGFDNGFGSGGDAGGTSWLQTQALVTGGETLSIRFAIWDTGDTALDSTAVIDAFEWIANGGTVVVETTPAQ
ncbi:MAG: choice-of-anchor L domain-containing protein [Polyangiaceae bacterium]|nr:choice-of-anchor L domain-containing protein [Polyangiaceae bacterium]